MGLAWRAPGLAGRQSPAGAPQGSPSANIDLAAEGVGATGGLPSSAANVTQAAAIGRDCATVCSTQGG
ncbi:hypothetical protein CO2235_MP20161 [Cupriavidus oxalaticus]|uniref:Uncharacterized protein n=1 Tax=Cupriavidus oxalaticus TaxID=96344 RepID=A0A976BHF8_9BURK|nr:hypothetical protein CO2235_MP20161 [Cupriavidus oxalaticus]